MRSRRRAVPTWVWRSGVATVWTCSAPSARWRAWRRTSAARCGRSSSTCICTTAVPAPQSTRRDGAIPGTFPGPPAIRRLARRPCLPLGRFGATAPERECPWHAQSPTSGSRRQLPGAAGPNPLRDRLSALARYPSGHAGRGERIGVCGCHGIRPRLSVLVGNHPGRMALGASAGLSVASSASSDSERQASPSRTLRPRIILS